MEALALTGFRLCTAFGGILHEVALADLPCLVLDGHETATGDHVIEFEGRMRVGMDFAPAQDLEFAHQLEVPAERLLAHLARLEEPPDGHGALMLGRSRNVFD